MKAGKRRHFVNKNTRLGRGAEGEYYMEYVSGGLTFPRNIFNAPKLKMAAYLASKLPDKAKVLDAGCGAGYVSDGLAGRLELTGIDIEKAAIDFCKKHRKGKFLVANLEKLPFRKDYFDLIIFTNTIEHLEDPGITLSELKRVLKPNGKLFVTTENCSNIFWLILEQTWYRVFGGPCKPFLHEVHPQRYTPSLLRKHLSDYFKIEKISTAILGMEFLAVVKKPISKVKDA